MGWGNFDFFYSKTLKRILTYDKSKEKAVLLDADLNVTATSTFTSYWHYAAIEINNTLLYSMTGDGSKYCLALVDNSLNLIHKLETSNTGLFLHRLDETHVILG